MTKLNLGKMVTDYSGDCCEPVKETKKKKISYPTTYISGIDLANVDEKLLGKTITIPVTLSIVELSKRTSARAGKKKEQNDSMDIQIMNLDFGKAPKSFETLQDAIEDGLSEE